MSDFIFSKKNMKQNIITENIQKIYNIDKPKVKEFHGEWGSLGVSRNIYNGFEPYETDQYLTVITGGPVLEFRDNNFLNENHSWEGTKSIFNRWRQGILKYEDDLNGPFVILFINKHSKEVTCITDLMSFIPVYLYDKNNFFVLSTHVDSLARITNQNDFIDEISVVDFILHGVVTFPFTIYGNIKQIPPASEHYINTNLSSFKIQTYWLPTENNLYSNINTAAQDVRSSLEKFVGKVTDVSTNITQFISGGEDSRTLSGILKRNSRKAYIFLDYMNREGRIAEKVADSYGAELKVQTRDKLHYLDILSDCSDLVGSGSQYCHAHTYGFHKECKLNSYTAVFGGLFSDALLKGARIKKIRGTGRLPLIPAMKNKKYSPKVNYENKIFKQETLDIITSRRDHHLENIKVFRFDSAEEWFELWPSSMNMNISNIHANRRLFPSYEPFMSSSIVKISAKVPQKWKLNRKLFHKSAKIYLNQTKYLLHGDGWFPYFPWYINSVIGFLIQIYRKIGIKLGFIRGNQGSWGQWSNVLNSSEWIQTYENYASGLHKISNVFEDNNKISIAKHKHLKTMQEVNLMQILYKLSRK